MSNMKYYISNSCVCVTKFLKKLTDAREQSEICWPFSKLIQKKMSMKACHKFKYRPCDYAVY